MESENRNKTPQTMRNIFGVVMILIYLGMGVLFLMNFFQFTGAWEILRLVGGVLFIVYGIWRGYRQFKGIDPGFNDR